MGTLGLSFLAINVRDSAAKSEARGQTGTFAMQRLLPLVAEAGCDWLLPHSGRPPHGTLLETATICHPGRLVLCCITTVR